MSQTNWTQAHSLWQRTVLLVALALVLLAPKAVAAQSSDDPLTIPAGLSVQGNIATTSQSIVVEGTVEGDVTSWSGNITIRGQVSGDVVSYTGQIRLGPSARVSGNVLVLDGQLQREGGAAISGQTLDSISQGGALGSLLDLFTTGAGQTDEQFALFGHILLSTVLGVLVLAFCTVWSALWPRATNSTALIIRTLPARSTALGLLTTTILAVALLPVVALLSATIIGLPLVAVLLVALHIVYIYGLAALVQALGAADNAALAGDHGPNQRTIGIALGLAALVGLVSLVVPAGGLVLVYLLASAGVGALILRRGGLALPQPA